MLVNAALLAKGNRYISRCDFGRAQTLNTRMKLEGRQYQRTLDGKRPKEKDVGACQLNLLAYLEHHRVTNPYAAPHSRDTGHTTQSNRPTQHDAKLVKLYHNDESKGRYFSVDLTGAKLNEGDLTHVRTVNPHKIILAGSNVTDDNLWELYGALNGEIDLSGTKVSDTGVEKLRNVMGPRGVIVK